MSLICHEMYPIFFQNLYPIILPYKRLVKGEYLFLKSEISVKQMAAVLMLEPLSPVAAEEVDVEVKYKGYIDKQKQESCGP